MLTRVTRHKMFHICSTAFNTLLPLIIIGGRKREEKKIEVRKRRWKKKSKDKQKMGKEREREA